MFDSREQATAVRLFVERHGPLPRRPDRAGLEQLLGDFAHLPYENISKIVAWNGGRGVASPLGARLQGSEPGWPPGSGVADPRSLGAVLRDPTTVMRDHLALGSGGTCFSLTALLLRLLEAAGYEAHPVMAHMRHGLDIHCAVRVELEGGAHLVDPGYLLRQPIPLGQSRLAEPAPGQPLLVRAGQLGGVPPQLPPGDFDLFTVEPEGPRWRYRFSDRAPSPEEFLAHWRRSFELPGMRSLLCTRRLDQELLYLHNHKLRQQRPGQVRTRNLRADLPGSVQQIFGIDPALTRLAVSLLEAQRASYRQQRGLAGSGAAASSSGR